MKTPIPCILVISPEKILPPAHGGSIRAVSVIVGLSSQFRVLALVPQSFQEIDQVLRTHPELSKVQWVSSCDVGFRLSRNRFQRLIERVNDKREQSMRSRWNGIIHDWAFGPLYSWHSRIRSLMKEYQPNAVVMQHTRHAATLHWIKRRFPKTLAVVDSQNVESDLVRQLVPQDWAPRRQQSVVRKVENYERKMHQYCDLLWACSKPDLDRYRALGVNCKHMDVVAKGVDTNLTEYLVNPTERTNPIVLFVGTLCYAPNIQAIDWFHAKIWPRLKASVPNVKWHIVGRWATEDIRTLCKSEDSIELFEDVPSTLPYLHESSVGICPLLSGSGTRLKILEAFAAGLPMVSTSLGVEGIEAERRRHLRIADSPDEFADATIALIKDPAEAEVLRRSARELVVQKYDWTVITEIAARQILSLID